MLGMHPWQQRYFCLYADRIVYAEEAGAAQQSGTIAIAAITDHYHLVRGIVLRSFRFVLAWSLCAVCQFLFVFALFLRCVFKKKLLGHLPTIIIPLS